MASESPTSFSAGRRWGIFFSVVISIVAMIALVVIANYLGTRYYARLNWNHEMQIKLSPQTRFLLKSVTNQVKVVVYFDSKDKLYSYVAGWLDEFRLANPKISIQTVDYPRQPVLAQEIKTTYKLSMTDDKNLVIFDCEGRRKKIFAASLGDFTYEQIPNAKGEREFTTKLLAFEGEKQFSSALLSVMNPKPRKAYFLWGHGEADVESSVDEGYQKFAKILQDSDVTNAVLKLSGTNPIPADCNLLIVPGPTKPFPREDLLKIKQYLDQGGRLFALFRYQTYNRETGLEALLADWNIGVGMNYLDDPENTQPKTGVTVISQFYNNHPLSSQMLASQSAITMLHPRSIEDLGVKQGPETPKVDKLAYTGPNVSVVTASNAPRAIGRPVAVMAAMEKATMKGVFPLRGTTAILAVGDSEFLNNKNLSDFPDNGDFAGFAINWLLDQTLSLQGVGPHAVKEYKLTMTAAQMNSVRWIFVAAVPGAILAFGILVWFRRRH